MNSFLEMVNGKPLFAGVSESDQIKKIFKIRGTPNEKEYPDLSTFPDWNVSLLYIIIAC
jgi:hypothetical protein